MTIADEDFIPEILTTIDQNREDAGWNKPAQLYALRVENVTDELSAIEVTEFPGFDIAMESRGHSYYALEMIRSLLCKIATLNAAGGNLPIPDMGGLFALALVDEAYMVERESGQPEPSGNFADIPGAVEQRFVLLVAGDLSTRVLLHDRATGTITQDVKWRDGRIMKAMLLLLLGVALPAGGDCD